MIRIISCVIIGRYFSQLAFDNNRNRWGAGLLAGFATLVIQIIFEVIIALFFIDALQSNSSMAPALLISIIGMALGTLVMVGVYRLFKKSWEASPNENNNLLDK